MHGGNSIVFMDLERDDAKSIVECAENLASFATKDQKEILSYISRLIENSSNRPTIKCIFEESQIDSLLTILQRFSNRSDLVNQVQNSIQ